MAFLRIGQAEARASDLTAEADRRGDAVTTPATDVRTLRAQIKAKGETPAAPDPGDAVSDLPARAEVPVPIPGPRGAEGRPRPCRTGSVSRSRPVGYDRAGRS
ncbi:hypothetical protein OH809_20180 [Streptomyces sp. NBC_00873]|uniref:hypothetical protein n=1 Tax=unclassified Streptomyces TaxID=2593676 RepID=UPI0038702F4F|nr:hypothetical protein OH809_20180 [Streptomyces sp. NBC_00873]WTA45212.1 hypothetical protein OH821_23520 [Streptomyces sp. NBC_00842]